jgi:hypothetical protein
MFLICQGYNRYKVLVQAHIQVSPTQDVALKVPTLSLSMGKAHVGQPHPSDLVGNMEEGVYCERARRRPVLVACHCQG